MSHSVHQSPLRASIVKRLRNRSNKFRTDTQCVPLYKRRTKILSHPPPNRVTPVFGTQIFHVDTFDINSIRQGLVPIHGSAAFIRVTRRARSSAFSFPYNTMTGQLFTRPVPRVPSHYMQTACVALPL